MISTTVSFIPQQNFLEELKHDLTKRLKEDEVLPKEIKVSRAVFDVLVLEAKVNPVGLRRLNIPIPGVARYTFQSFGEPSRGDRSFHQVTVVSE